MKRPRKVALVNVYDYPRNDYSAYWGIHVTGDDVEGYRWGAQLLAYEPIAWLYQGTRTTERPDVPMPAFPPDLPRLPRNATAAQIRADAIAQDARRAEIARIAEASPKPVYLIEETVGVEMTRDEADTAAQTWVLERMPAHRRAEPLDPLSDEDVRAKVEEFDRALAAREFAVVDRIRGELKSQGIALTEAPRGSGQASQWSRQSGRVLALGPAGLLVSIATVLLGRLGKLLAGLVLAIAYSTTIRSNRMTQVLNACDLGAGAALFRIYDSTRPATCGTATTLLAELTCSDPSGSVSSGVLTFSAITADSSANATGTASWFRIVDSTGTCCIDGAVGTSGSDLNLNSTSIASGQQVSVSSCVLTEGSA